MIIDFRGRPPTEEFLTYFDAPRVERMARHVGAKSMSDAFVTRSVSAFFREMEEAGITRTVALGRNSPELMHGTKRFPPGIIPNAHIVDLQRRYPDRIIGFAGIDASNTLHDALKEIDTYVAREGLHGIFVEPQRAFKGHPDDPRIFPIYERCLELDVPVVISSGPYSGPDISFTDPAHIDVVASQFPELKIVCGHGCWPYVLQIIAVAYKHPNVYISPDCYHFVVGGEDYVVAANTFMGDQLLFGTGYPFRPLKQTVEDFRRLGLQEDALEKALYRNAQRLLGLSG